MHALQKNHCLCWMLGMTLLFSCSISSLNRCDSLLLLTKISASERTTEEYKLPGGKMIILYTVRVMVNFDGIIHVGLRCLYSYAYSYKLIVIQLAYIQLFIYYLISWLLLCSWQCFIAIINACYKRVTFQRLNVWFSACNFMKATCIEETRASGHHRAYAPCERIGGMTLCRDFLRT